MVQKLIALVICLVAFNLYFFSEVPLFSVGTVGFLLLMAVCHAVLQIAYFKPGFNLNQKVSFSASALAVVATGIATLRANEVDHGLLWLMSMGLSAISWYVAALNHNHFGAVSELAMMPLQLGFGWLFSGIRQLEKSPSFFKKIFGGLKGVSVPAPIKVLVSPAVIRGLIFVVPVVFVLISLLKGADPIFGSVIDRLFSWNIHWPTISGELPARLVFSAILVTLAIPAINLVISDRFKSPFRQAWWGSLKTEAVMVVGAVAAVLALFLAVQFRYLFAAVPETELHQFGINTYSEYVRRGFSELVMVAGLIYGVVGLSLGVLRMLPKRSDLLTKLNLLVLGEGLIFIGSIFRRVLLYQADHGLTRVRVYGSAFLVVMVALTVVLMLRHVMKKKVFWSALEIGVIASGLFMAVAFNVDNAIATRFPPTVNQEVDYNYISRLSADGVDGWIASYRHAQGVLNTFDVQTFNKQVATDEQARNIVYTFRTLYALENNYSQLEGRYEARTDGLFLNRNLAEQAAYERLKQEIPRAELQGDLAKVRELQGLLIEEQLHKSYDRSADTPLLD